MSIKDPPSSIPASISRERISQSSSENGGDKHVSAADAFAIDDIWGKLVSASPSVPDVILATKKHIRKSHKQSVNDNGHASNLKKNESSGGGYLIGRSTECDVLINDPVISKRHCFLYRKRVFDNATGTNQDCCYIEDTR